MPAVTALRAARGGRVLVEFDGEPWRVVPVEVVAAAGLRLGTELDRVRVRALRRALRRSEAMAVAGRALRHRDLSRARLDERLQRRGVPPAQRGEAMDVLERAGVVDDERYAHGRAAALAERGYGDEAIRFDLERQGIAAELLEGAIAELEPEPERATMVARRRPDRPGLARFLVRRGFGEDAVEAALAATVAERG